MCSACSTSALLARWMATQWRVRYVLVGAHRSGVTLAQQAANYKSDVGGAFTKPAHKVREPFATERDVYADPVTGVAQLRLQIPANPVQHLELEAVGRDAVGRCKSPRRVDHGGIVRGNGGVLAARQQQLHAVDERGVHLGLALVRHAFG